MHTISGDCRFENLLVVRTDIQSNHSESLHRVARRSIFCGVAGSRHDRQFGIA